MKTVRIIGLVLASLIVIGGAMYLRFHPGYLARPGVGDTSQQMQAWLTKYGYESLDDKTAGTNLYEAEREDEREKYMLERRATREATDTLLSIGRLHRQQSLCGSGLYFVFWRLDNSGTLVAEIYFDDQFCYI